MRSKRDKFLSHWMVGSMDEGSNTLHEENSNDADALIGSSDVEVQCNLGDQKGEDLNAKIIMLDNELRERNKEIYKLKEENARLKDCTFGFNQIRTSNDRIKFFTGIPTLAIFLWIAKLVKSIKRACSSFSVEDHILIVLMKLRLGLMNRDIAYRYGCKPAIISKVYRKWLPEIASRLQNLIIWPSRAELRANLPQSFKPKYRDCACIIDCSEIFIQRPRDLTARAQTWSNYKHNNTIEYLIGISPAGAVMFLSEGWGGRVSDKQITLESGFLNKIVPGDCILADRGFLIEDDLNRKGAYLSIPKFTKGKTQLPARDVHGSRHIANVRIHVERVIGALKNFRILQTTIPITQVDLIDKVMITVCALVNLRKSVVPK